ncbi:MAG: glycerol-3-phosphate acyltransferase [Dehalococcoidales bacterium]|nr:glycerol-3-phosphate acyltransferase [Dehalococcoidales bacterium]
MSWLIIILGYLLGSIPTAHIAGRLLKGKDIRQMGDGNVGAANAFRQLGRKTGIAVFLIDAAKGALAVLIARMAGTPQLAVLAAGVASVIGHNWPVFIGFRGGRGFAITIGVLAAVVPLPILILTGPGLVALLVSRSTGIAGVVVFIPLPLISWWVGLSWELIAYSAALPCLLGVTHYLRVKRIPDTSGEGVA